MEQLEDRVTPSVNPAAPFELDGNVFTQSPTTHDWDQVFANASGALANAFVTDKVNSNTDDIFQGGGSKDTLGIQSGQWLFTGSKPQGKDDITHAFAAAYTDPSSGHLILYAGLDRFDNSGDATAGFWFFGNNITENPNVTTNGGHPFVGTHQDGDILLVSDFTVGGSTSTIKVFRWTGNDSTGSLVALNNGNPISGNTFAVVNSGAISVPWSYTNKSGQHQPAAGEFLEEGVDLTALGLQGCFSTFMAETRSSQSPTATLSDFALGSFPLCSLAAPQFSGLSKFDTSTNQGDLVTYPLMVQNTGGMPLYIQTVSDSLLGNIVVNHTLQAPSATGVQSITSSFNFNTPLAPGDTLTINVTRRVQATDPDPTFNTTTFTGTDDLAGLSDPITTSVTDSVNLFQPSATLTESVSPTTATQAGQVITYTFTVNNTSSSDSPDLVLDLNNPNDSFTDSLLTTAAGYNLEADAIHAATGDNTATVASIAPGTSFTFTETRAIQPGDPSPLTDTSNVAFTLAPNFGTFTNIIHASGSGSVTLLPDLTIVKAVTTGFPTVIHPGDTASYTITVTNTGAGTATNVVVTDALPDASQLNWMASSSDFSIMINGGVLTATDASLLSGASATITISAVVPLDFFGTSPNSNLPDGVPLGLFELDGNATTGVVVTPNTPPGSTTPSHDWDQVFADAGSPTASGSFDTPGPLSGARTGSFVTDAVNSRTDDIFTGGGSKDINGIQNGPWLFTDAKPQGKDDIEHAFAALYTDPVTKDAILYAGLDRFDNSGDSTAGFWFFVNPLGEGAIAKGNGTGPFTGTHTTGDILLVSDFTQGGSVSTIRVFKWVGDDATGSLVALNNGNPIGGKTFAIVNGGNITLPWSFTNKSKTPGNVALPGEFLEEGINLTSLGLNPCFSTFLAETRSSQSPTATLSDFVLGSFETCDVQLPNTATVSADNFNNGQPISSSTVTIDVNDGHALLATALGDGTGVDALTVQQLQPVVAQAIAAWRAAGVDPGTLSNLDHVTFHVGILPSGELGYEVPGQVWIDQTAAGWGWSLDGSAVPGRMDLLSVVSHEVGHALGFDHGSSGVMDAALAPGMRLVPEALSGTGSITGVISRATDAVAAPSHVPQAAFNSTAMVDAVFAVTRGVAPTVTTLPDRAATPASILLNLATPIPTSLSTVATPPATVRTGTERDSTGDPVPGLWPPSIRRESGNENATENDIDDELATPPNPSEALSWQHASDACFAGDSWRASLADTRSMQPEDAVQATETPAAAVLVLALAGWWGARPTAAASRRRQRLLIDSF